MEANITNPAPGRILKRITSNYGWSLISDVGGKGFLFLVTIYLARKLGVKQFGVFTFAQTLASYFWLGVDLGINMYGSREISRDRDNAANIVNPLLTLRVVCGLLVFGLFVAVSLFLSEDRLQMLVFAGCALYLVTRALNTDWVLRGLERFEYMAMGNFVAFISMLGLMVLLVRDGSDVATAAYVWSFSYLLGGAAMLWALSSKLGISFRPSFDTRTWRGHLRESLHFTASGVLINLYMYMPILFLGFFSTRYDVGIFSAPFKVVTSVVFAAAILPLSLYPVFSELYVTDRTRFDRLLAWFIAASAAGGVAIGLAGTFLARDVMLLFFGESYIEGAWVLGVISWYAALVPLRMAFRTAIAASGLQRYYTIVASLGVFGFAALFFLLRGPGGMPVMKATCVALVAAEVVVMGSAAAVWKLKGGTAPPLGTVKG